MGHQTVIGQTIFFTAKNQTENDHTDMLFNKSALSNSKSVLDIDTSIEYQFVDEIKFKKPQALKVL